ncbi:MAG: Gfo/Idh/MocA family oxidoreductase, partial [Planctomycetaceae bacterium]|nr:Gfo/Idh/MocA family oxidoreductase [Planctomycetaceae bacterium]
DYRELAGRVDGVVLATPPSMHHAMAMYFLERGVHVLCEKPLAESLSAAEEMVNAAVRNQVALAVNQTRRLFPNISKVRELIAGGVLGDLRSIIYHDGVIFDWPAASPFHFAPGSRGALSDTGIHLLDTVCWWLDAKPELVSSRNDSLGGPEAVATVRMRHEECEIEVKVSRLARLRNSFRIVGTRGTIDAVAEHWDRVVVQSPNGRTSSVQLRHKIDSYATLAKPLLSNFVNVIATGASPLISGASALPAVALLEEAYEAAEPYDRPWNTNLELLDVA